MKLEYVCELLSLIEGQRPFKVVTLKGTGPHIVMFSFAAKNSGIALLRFSVWAGLPLETGVAQDALETTLEVTGWCCVVSLSGIPIRCSLFVC